MFCSPISSTLLPHLGLILLIFISVALSVRCTNAFVLSHRLGGTLAGEESLGKATGEIWADFGFTLSFYMLQQVPSEGFSWGMHHRGGTWASSSLTDLFPLSRPFLGGDFSAVCRISPSKSPS